MDGKSFGAWLWHKVLQTKKAGDTVNIDMSQVVESTLDECALCHEPTAEEINSGLIYLIDEEKLCESHKKELTSNP